MSFPKYSEYADSGVAMLNQVPVHWEVRPLKHICTCNDEVLSEKTPPGTLIEYVEISDVDNVSGVTGSTSYEFSDAPSRARRVVRDQDVIVSTVRTYLKAIAPVRSPPANQVVSTGFAVIRPNFEQVKGGYLGYLCRSEEVISEIIARSVGVSYPAINSSEIMQLPVPVPSASEQTQIVRFLDHETAKIDTLIQEQKRLIELLQEKRQAVISHSVTKGLDPGVPMKDSGVEWLGEVPAHWKIVPLKRVVVFQRGHDLPTDSRKVGNIPVVSSGGISGRHDTAIARAPGIVTGRYGSIGQFTLVEEDYWPLNTALYSIELNAHLVRYVWYLLHSVSEHFVLNSMKSAVPGVDRNDIHKVSVVIAPSRAQSEITQYLDSYCAQINNLSQEARRAVDLLQERRSALISAAVTGKIDVRDWQPPVDESAFDAEIRQTGLEATA